MKTQDTKIEKCICACHENKLKRPYEHDHKCCRKMNGFLFDQKIENILKFLKQFYNDNESGGSSRWMVAPNTVEIWLRNVLKSYGTECEQRGREDERKKWIAEIEIIVEVLKGENLSRFAKTIEKRIKEVRNKKR